MPGTVAPPPGRPVAGCGGSTVRPAGASLAPAVAGCGGSTVRPAEASLAPAVAGCGAPAVRSADASLAPAVAGCRAPAVRAAETSLVPLEAAPERPGCAAALPAAAGPRRTARLALVLLAAFPLLASDTGTDPKPKASDYPVHAAAGKIEIGAEYMIRSFGEGRNWYVAPEYLVVEIAVYPARGETFAVSSGSFTLRINRKKQELYSQSPGMVAASLKYSDWEIRRGFEVSGGLGDAGVILGRRQPTERFPGDRRPTDGRLPQPPTLPDSAPGGVERDRAPKAEDVALAKALPEGDIEGPVSGYLYFAWKGKPKSIKTLELRYRAPDGAITVLPLI